MATTQVILKQKIQNLGAEGDVVKVRAGFARNFLLPQSKAFEATPGNLRRLESLKKVRVEREAKELEEAEKLATKLLQSRLAQLGYDLGKAGVDGIRGDKTLGALFAYQTTAGLEPDSIDGPKTWAALTTPKGTPS